MSVWEVVGAGSALAVIAVAVLAAGCFFRDAIFERAVRKIHKAQLAELDQFRPFIDTVRRFERELQLVRWGSKSIEQLTADLAYRLAGKVEVVAQLDGCLAAVLQCHTEYSVGLGRGGSGSVLHRTLWLCKAGEEPFQCEDAKRCVAEVMKELPDGWPAWSEAKWVEPENGDPVLCSCYIFCPGGSHGPNWYPPLPPGLDSVFAPMVFHFGDGHPLCSSVMRGAGSMWVSTTASSSHRP